MASHSDSVEQLSPVKRALLEVREIRAKLDAIQQARTEPIAVVGLGVRLPGSVSTADAFWELLREGRDAITEIPSARWDVDAYYDVDPDAPGKMYARRGGFVDDVDRFDPQFFGISPREAASLDPQQRLLLEVSWETLENAGVSPSEWAGSQTGVFVGITNNDYSRLLFTDVPAIDAYFASGASSSAAAGRLSYALGFRGPCLAVDTACSSSLVAIHLACRSLRANECDRALAGGVNLILTPELNIAGAKSRMLAPDGACKTFDARADGYVRSEGCGMVALKRLSHAVRDGDRVLALIRGSAINQDGRSSGLTVPYGPSQEAVIRAALLDGGAEPADVGLIEAHGTGTFLGDPIELKALASVFGRGRSSENPLLVSSVKTNIGHLESAAGVAGLIKVILSLEHQEIPPHLHFSAGNPHFDWDSVAMVVPIRPTSWTDRNGRPRLAGVSSFGFSGTNAHIVLEAAPQREPKEASIDRPVHVIALSAKSDAALRDLADRYDVALRARDLPIGDVAFTANTGRSHFTHRVAVVAESTAHARAGLQAFRAGEESPLVRSGEAADGTPDVAFLFTGQGAQFPGMGRQLFETHQAFRSTLLRCDELLRPHLDRSLLSVMHPAPGDEHLIDQTMYTQPALFALAYALCELWRSWGVEPAALLGHSLGEDVAACVAGVFTLEDGLKLIAARGRLMQALPDDGEMATVFADEDRVRAAVGRYRSDVSIAAVNGPSSIAISGRRGAIQSIVEKFRGEGVSVKPMAAGRAFHSPLMDPMLDEFHKIAAGVQFSAPRIPLLMNLTGGVAAVSDAPGADYWRRHIREAVQFKDGMETLHQLGCGLFLEIGPGATLLGMGRRCLPDDAGIWLTSLRKGRDDWQEMLTSLSTLYARGVDVDWRGFDSGYRRSKVALPTYPFQRERHWVAPARSDRAHPLRAAASATPDEDSDFLDRWTYVVTWTEESAPERVAPSAASVRGSWLIFADSGGVGSRLADRLRARGDRCRVIFAGQRFEETATDTLSIQATSTEDFELVLRTVSADEDTSGVVFLWGLDAPAADSMTCADLEAAQTLGTIAAFRLVQAMRAAGLAAPMRIVTRCAQPARGPSDSATSIAVAQTPLWGLGRVVAVEHPELWAGLVDLDANDVDHAAGDLLQEIDRRDDEDQVALRNGCRYVARLERCAVSAEASAPIRADGAYLITGGLGVLGLKVARWLVEQGARHLTLMGRTGLPDRDRWSSLPTDSEAFRRVAAIREIEQFGATVEIAAIDVTDQPNVAACIDRFGRTAPPLRGIVHAASAGGAGRIGELSVDALTAMLGPKVAGTWALHRATAAQDLDFFVLFSSIAALLGSIELGHYAAANSFLDAFAHYRRSASLRAISVNWGAWSDIRASADLQQVFARSGTGFMTADHGLAAFGRVRSIDIPQLAVAPIDWATFKPVFEARRRRPFLDRITVQGERGRAASAGDELARQLALASVEDRWVVLRAHVSATVASVVGLAADQIDPRKGLFDLGMDSLMSVELKSRLETTVGCSLPTTLTFKYPTVTALAEFIGREMGIEVTPGAPAPRSSAAPAGSTTPVAAQTSSHDELSEDDLAALLLERVEQIR